MTRSPDFIIVGAMKCGTSTLAAQLGAQTHGFMTDPKEPNFFSDDDVYDQGLDWYHALFASAPQGALLGEASTHYTKLPTYPHTLERMQAALPDVKIVYMIRNPMQRAVSHFIHEWSMGNLDADLSKALTDVPEIQHYGCYHMQIAPFVAAYGAENVLLSSLEQLKSAPQEELSRIAGFIGMPGPIQWQEDLSQQNASAERIRSNPLIDFVVANPVTTALRRTLVPKSLRSAIRSSLTMKDRPEIPADQQAQLWAAFRADHAELTTLFPGHPALELCYADMP